MTMAELLLHQMDSRKQLFFAAHQVLLLAKQPRETTPLPCTQQYDRPADHQQPQSHSLHASMSAGNQFSRLAIQQTTQPSQHQNRLQKIPISDRPAKKKGIDPAWDIP